MSEVKEKIKANEIIKFLLAVFSLIIITIVSIIINKDQKNALNFITNKYFLISFIGIIIFSYYVYSIKKNPILEPQNYRLKKQ